jgi:multiple sugar transport system substrate-binding protein
VTLNWYVFPEPSGSFQAAATECSKASHGAYNININFLSTSSDQQRVSLVRRLAANDSSIDILAMDVDWTAEFATAKWLAPVPANLSSLIESQDLAGPVQTATWQGRLWGVPINSNTELLWYRKDLVPNPPTTWSQMITDANRLAAEGKPHYIEEQGAQYEGLTVWFNSMVDSAGGTILSPDNKVVLGAPAVAAATIMRDVAISKGADPSLNVSMEGPGQVAFQSGTAAFMINYPFVWSATQAGNASVFKTWGTPCSPRSRPASPRVSRSAATTSVSRPSPSTRTWPSRRFSV